MLEFQWNALRVGDRVVVHDDRDRGLERHEAVVVLVQTRPRSVNEIGVRRTMGSGPVLRPRRHAVHLLPIEPGHACWRCGTGPERSATP